MAYTITASEGGRDLKIAEVVYQQERDFSAVLVCEHCGHSYKEWGYIDDYFMREVLPQAVCPNCHKNRAGDTEEELKRQGKYVFRI